MTDFYTGYTAAKLVNEYLTARGLKNIPPQMVYNYMKKGYIKTQTIQGQQMVHINTIEEWVEKYVAKKVANK